MLEFWHFCPAVSEGIWISSESRRKSSQSCPNPHCTRSASVLIVNSLHPPDLSLCDYMSANWICTSVFMTHWAVFRCPKSIGTGKIKTLKIEFFLFRIVAGHVSFSAPSLLSSFDSLLSAEVGSRSDQAPVDIRGFKYQPYTAVSDTLIYHAGFRLKTSSGSLFFTSPLDLATYLWTWSRILKH